MSCERVKPRIPIVDLSSGKQNSWKSACNEVRDALEEYGCFELVYTKPSIEFHKTILDALEQLFELPYETKMKNTHPKPFHAYVAKIPTIHIYEGFGIEYATNKQECQDFTQLMWPLGNEQVCESVHSCAKLGAEVNELMVKMLCESYGIEKEYSESHVQTMTYLMRLMKYSRRSEDDSNVGLSGHTDKNFMSVLNQNHVNGLQIRTKDHHWITYQPSSHSSFIVMAGDACMGWSNDRIKSCYHRVMVEGEEIRYAIGLFCFLKGLVKAPKELVDENHPLKYKPFEHQLLMSFYESSNDPNKGDINIVKAYCGI